MESDRLVFLIEVPGTPLILKGGGVHEFFRAAKEAEMAWEEILKQKVGEQNENRKSDVACCGVGRGMGHNFFFGAGDAAIRLGLDGRLAFFNGIVSAPLVLECAEVGEFFQVVRDAKSAWDEIENQKAAREQTENEKSANERS
ncbi:MAG: hypothetical protein GX881_08035 [Firmicutes bacterium]|nr:hypothetical protein [Bacillota bacterium]